MESIFRKCARVAVCAVVLVVGACSGLSSEKSPEKPSLSKASVPQDTYNLRLDVFVVEQNQAVTALISSKRPSQWQQEVTKLFLAGNAPASLCEKVNLRFSNLDIDIPPVDYRLAPYDWTSKRFVGSLPVPLLHVQAKGYPAGIFFHEALLTVKGGAAAYYIPGPPFKGSENPVVEVWIDGVKLLGLPQGNDTNHLVTTPRNDQYKTVNQLHQALSLPYKNATLTLVVPPGSCQARRL